MNKILFIALMTFSQMVSAETPPLNFISIDCTQYGSPGAPALVMLNAGVAMIGPLSKLDDTPEAMEFYLAILELDHESWVDQACAI